MSDKDVHEKFGEGVPVKVIEEVQPPSYVFPVSVPYTTCPYCHGMHASREDFVQCRDDHGVECSY